MTDFVKYGAVLLALSLVITTGCLGTVDADEVRNDSLDAMETTETYEFETEMNVTVSGEGMPGELSVGMDGEGAVDEGKERMKMLTTVDMLGMEMDQDAYVVDDTMYTKMDMSGTKTQGTEGMNDWYKIEDEPMVSRMWNASSYAEQYQQTLDISEVSYEEDAEVDGKEAYVISLEPDPDDYDELIQDRMAGMNMMDSMPGSEGSGVFEDIRVEDVSATYWISKETDHVLRTRSNTTMEMSMGAMAPEGGEGMTMNMVADVRLSNHGEDVDIELPDGAEGAEEFESVFEGEAASSSQSVGNASNAHEVGVDVPEDPEVDEEVDDLVEGVDVEVHEYEGAPDTHWAKVSLEDSEGEWLKVESVESGGSASTDSPGSTNYLGISVAPEGDEIVVTLGKEDGTVVQQRETYEP